MNYEQKYLKYKTKYLKSKQEGGGSLYIYFLSADEYKSQYESVNFNMKYPGKKINYRVEDPRYSLNNLYPHIKQNSHLLNYFIMINNNSKQVPKKMYYKITNKDNTLFKFNYFNLNDLNKVLGILNDPINLTQSFKKEEQVTAIKKDYSYIILMKNYTMGSSIFIGAFEIEKTDDNSVKGLKSVPIDMTTDSINPQGFD